MSYTFIDGISDARASENYRIRHYELWGKRAFDIIWVVLILPIALPVLLAAWAITVIGGGSGFYGQQRIGQGGRIFQCWKVRTMRPDTDHALAKLVADCPDIAREWQANQKLKCDPRITPVGRFLRRTSIDELPQLWNVLTGEMSLIGPRPFTPTRSRYTTRPGPIARITGCVPESLGCGRFNRATTACFRIGWPMMRSTRIICRCGMI